MQSPLTSGKNCYTVTSLEAYREGESVKLEIRVEVHDFSQGVFVTPLQPVIAPGREPRCDVYVYRAPESTAGALVSADLSRDAIQGATRAIIRSAQP